MLFHLLWCCCSIFSLYFQTYELYSLIDEHINRANCKPNWVKPCILTPRLRYSCCCCAPTCSVTEKTDVMVLAPVMVLAYVMVNETADMVVNKEADIVVDDVADMEVDKVADMVANMVADKKN